MNLRRICTPGKTVQSITTQYAQVTSVHNGGMSTGSKVGIGILIGAGAFCTTIVVSALIVFK